MIFDRINNTLIDESELPSHINLGRYLIAETNEELCADNLPSVCDSTVSDAFLADTYSTTHKILRKLTQEISGVITCKDNLPSPIIRNVCNEIKLTNFEEHLYENIRYIKAAFEKPHSKLNRIEEKVNVSKAKRITPRSYQYLGAHTEDWQQYSIVSFRPERVLTEELSLDYDIYENRLLVAFVQRTLAYLRGRLQSIGDSKEFIKEYRSSLFTYQKSLSGEAYWYAKPERNLQLFGREYHDENYITEGSDDDESITDSTYKTLRRLMNECVIMLGKNLTHEVNLKSLESITYHDTNVLLGHPNYKHIKSLWKELNTEIQEFSINRLYIEHQEILRGLVSYANALVKYIVVKYFLYDIRKESENGWMAIYKDNKYPAFPSICLSIHDGVLTLEIGSHIVRIVTIVSELTDQSIPDDCIILKYNLRQCQEIKSNKPERIINVNLKDINSVERLAMYMRSILVGLHIKNIKAGVIEPQSVVFLHPEKPVRKYSDSNNYLMMDDYFVLNINEKTNSALFSNTDPELKHLSYNDWGMDNISISNYNSF